MPDNVLSAGNIALKELKFFPSWVLYLLGEGKTDNKQTYISVGGKCYREH